MDRVYRVCRRCGEAWNVSAVFPGEKVYICPWCEARERKKRREQEGGRKWQGQRRT